MKIISYQFFRKMGDSDDDREFRRRDKFHNERRGYEGGGGGGGPPRGEWREPRPLPPPSYAYRGRPAYGGGGGRDRYSPEPRGRRHHEMSPPPKRMRGGWEDERYEQTCVAEPDSAGSVCFWATWIRIRILLLSSKNSKKNLNSYCFVTSL